MALKTGVKHLRDGIEPQLVIGSDMAVLAVVGTAPNAEVAKFPLNQPIFVKTNDTVMRTALGSGGTIEDALVGISAQLTSSAKSAKVVVVRVEDDADAFQVIANIVGSEANRTGIWALLDAPSELGITPRLVVTPGYTSQSKDGIGSPVISAAGADGTDGTFAVIFTGGTGSGAAGEFTVTSGAVTSVTITDPGEYTVAPTIDLTNSAGLTGATVAVSLEQSANAVCAAIPTILSRLKAKFVPEGPTSTRQAYLDWIETLPASADILHPLRVDVEILDSEGDTVTKPASPYIAALYARRDSELGGIPSGSVHNQPVYGITGVTPSIDFSWTDENAEGQMDLEISAGIVVRGEVGVDDAVGSAGFTFLGTDTLSTDSQWLFAHVVRMRDYIELAQMKAQVAYIGKRNITVQTIEVIIQTMKSHLSTLAQGDHILVPFYVTFNPDENNPEELRDGEIDIVTAVEEPPVLRRIINRSRRHREALNALTLQIATSLGATNS